MKNVDGEMISPKRQLFAFFAPNFLHKNIWVYGIQAWPLGLSTGPDNQNDRRNHRESKGDIRHVICPHADGSMPGTMYF